TQRETLARSTPASRAASVTPRPSATRRTAGRRRNSRASLASFIVWASRWRSRAENPKDGASDMLPVCAQVIAVAKLLLRYLGWVLIADGAAWVIDRLAEYAVPSAS